MTVQGIDISNFQGEITPALAGTWAAAGVQHVVVRASLERQAMRDLARRQMVACKDAGLSISGYGWYYQSVDPADWAQQTLDAYGDLGLVRVWIDCEETADVGRPGEIANWLYAWFQTLEAAGMPTGTYTGQWWWDQYMPGVTTSATVRPLWNALYDRVMDLNVWTPYGGWAAPSAKQYADDGMVGGMKLDMDIFDESVVSAAGGPVDCSEYINLLGYLQGDVRQALQDALDGARAAKTKQQRNDAYQSLQAAIDTLARGG